MAIISNINIIPITRKTGISLPVGFFVELEPNLFLMALESGLTDKVQLE